MVNIWQLYQSREDFRFLCKNVGVRTIFQTAISISKSDKCVVGSYLLIDNKIVHLSTVKSQREQLLLGDKQAAFHLNISRLECVIVTHQYTVNSIWYEVICIGDSGVHPQLMTHSCRKSIQEYLGVSMILASSYHSSTEIHVPGKYRRMLRIPVLAKVFGEPWKCFAFEYTAILLIGNNA